MSYFCVNKRLAWWPVFISITFNFALHAQAEVFEAEDFTVAFDTTSLNEGGAYRDEAVDIEVTTDTSGGYNVGWTAQGEWLVLGNVNVPTSGSYTISARVASPSGGKLAVDLNGGSIQLGELTIPETGGWQQWQTVSMTAELPAGEYALGVLVQNGGWNFNWLQVEADDLPLPSPSPVPPATILEAEDYDDFFDLTVANLGGAYRSDAVDIEAANDENGGFNVGWIDAGEWLVFENIIFPESGNYEIRLRTASLAGASASLDLNAGEISLGQLTWPATGGWQAWRTTSPVPVYVDAGTYDLRIFAVTANWNLNWIEVVSSDGGIDPSPTVTPTPTPTQTPNPGLVWSEEFDSIDRDKWNFETGGHGWGNVELQYYSDGDNASIEYDPQAGSNVLVIEARQEEGGECWNGSNCQFTSTRINTRDKHAFHYGRVEARIKLPRAQGVWPAFWMLGDSFGDMGWPQSGEIDIMEHAGANDITFCALHGPGYSGGTPITGNLVHHIDISSVYNIFTVEWDANSINWFVNDINIYSVTRAQVEQYGEWVFDQPFWILLNIAVGGTFGGTPDFDNFTTQRMYVDFVRVYQ